MIGADVFLKARLKAGKAVPDMRRRPWWMAGWMVAVAILIARFGGDALDRNFLEPDNAMRLVQVRDLMAGQGWFDLVQHRLGVAPGVEMHWARWIDGALAAQIGLLSPLLGQATAETIVAFAWPLGLLAMFMALIARACRAFGERDGMGDQMAFAGPMVAALAFPAIEKFGPGSFDHHNVELVLGMAALLGLMRMAASPTAAAMAGAALATAMATAAEGVPVAVVGVTVAGALWLFRPETYARAIMWLGAAMAATSCVMFLFLVPPGEWGRPVCDTMSPVYLTFGLFAGGVAAGLGFAPPRITRTLLRRLCAASVMAGLSGAVLLAAYPECARGGYSAVTAEMQTLWMAQVSESRSLLQLWEDDAGHAVSLGGAAVAALAAAALYLRSRWRQAEAWIAPAFVVMACGVLAWQIRGGAFATAFAIPLGAWAIISARAAWKAKARPAGLLGFAVVALASTSAGWAMVGGQVRSQTAGPAALARYHAAVGSAEACYSAAAMAPLRDVPTGRMLNHFSIGASVLVETPHSVFAAPYHRNTDGMMTMIRIMRTTSDAAWTLATWSGADYLLICPALPEGRFYARHPAPGVAPQETLAARLAAGDHPGWLSPVPLRDTPLRLYRIVPQAATGASPRQEPLRGRQMHD